MSAQSPQMLEEPDKTHVLEVSERSLSEIQEFTSDVSDVYFECRGGRTFLVANQ